MFAALLIAEVAFWGCLFLGLLTRYTFKQPQLGLWLLAMTPAIDFLLLIYAAYDLHNSGQAGFFHGFSAFYVVFSVVFGRDLITTMDRWFAGGKGKPEQAASLSRCVLASAITAIVLVGLIVITGMAGSFWLLYWLIAVVFTPLMWWGVERWNARRRSG